MPQKVTKEAVNQPVIDRYRLLRILNRSKNKTIYQATDIRTAKPVVLKLLRLVQGQEENQQHLQYFHKTMQNIAALDYPHIFPIFDFGKMVNEQDQHYDYVYITMPLAAGRSLDVWLNDYQQQQKDHVAQLPVQDILHFVRQTAESLQYAHDKDVLHLGIKQTNFLLRYPTDKSQLPHLELSDFSIARFIDLSEHLSKEPEASYAIAPELLAGQPTAASDQYALAALVYELLTGQIYIPEGRNRAQTPMLFSLGEQSSRLTPAVNEVLQRALASTPYERYPTITEFSEAFERAIRQEEPGEHIHIMLGISQAEALSGATYPLTLADKQRVTIQIPPNAHSGQTVQIPKAGRPGPFGGPRGQMIVTFAIRPNPNDNQQIIEQLRRLAKNVQALQAQPEEMQQQIREMDQKVTHIFHSYDEDDVTVHSLEDIPEYMKKHVSPGLAMVLGALIFIVVLSTCFLSSTLRGAIVANGNSNIQAITLSNTQITATANAQAHAEATATGRMQATATAMHTQMVKNAANTFIIPQQYHAATSDTTNLIFNDLMNRSNKGQWSEQNANNSSSCYFDSLDPLNPQKALFYHAKMTVKQNSPLFCQTSTGAGTIATGANFVIQAQMSIINGDFGGIAFSIAKNSFCYFYISSSGQYEIGMNNTPFSQGQGESSSINKGLGPNTSNVIAVAANGGSLTFYANLQPIFSIQGIQLEPKGNVAVIARSDGSPTNVGYQQIKVWAY